MAFERRSYSDSASPTAITSGIGPTDLSITIDSSAGWPAGGVNGPFFACIGRVGSTPELIEVQSRTGSILTIASTAKRGINGTSAGSWAQGATIEHVHTAQDADEANAHITNTALDHHTQYLNATRHDVTARHTVGTVIPAAAPGTILPDAVAAQGAANSVARSDHVHAIAAAAATTIFGSNTEGVATSFARSDHDHAIGAGVINSTNIFDGSVSTAKIANAAVTLAKLASEAASTYTPTLSNTTLGTGGFSYGVYFKFGRLVFGVAGWRLGTGGDVTGQVGISLPVAVNDRVSDASIANTGWVGAARAFDPGTATWQSGLGVIADDGFLRSFVTAGGNAQWDANTPWNWNDNDIFQSFFAFESTT